MTSKEDFVEKSASSDNIGSTPDSKEMNTPIGVNIEVEMTEEKGKEPELDMATPTKPRRSEFSTGLSTTSTPRKRSSSRTSSGKTHRNSSDVSPASMIFRNLLILEDDLRRQAREQKQLRRKYTAFLSLMAGLAGFTIYELFFNTSEYVKGIYRFFLQLTLCFIIITISLFNISGQYRRTIIIPRRFFNSTNKGIRQFNVRLVRVKSSWDEMFTDFVRFISNKTAMVNVWFFSKVIKLSDNNTIVNFWKSVTIRSQPRIGATDVKLILNPRAFSAEVREGWEIYRDEFWAREGTRRRKQAKDVDTKLKSA
ncbi:hypothetical protein KAFR_0K00790 [Kazachstania africana CBS 2517]|uniref:Spo7-like protein n=1 Tax=Kazachstania africana (strain ATCC 22294 / BCRC 22015 / CBS 2517 / CECT 1963 / NBRC 1671 / NRRL Y-8276) TaxID=1071382 RepID=H2B1D4_KAZAF|nr:hypothetical protein KAFR_0K00790 [Kazachstania africana CBS 2517]CCF60434.1 hypothetical protein KAFR_0K00790 [Kazachstania africana CBS 2517]